jgi:two-component sensor histidine kinase
MKAMFDPNFDPYAKIEYLERTVTAMAEALELLAEQQAQTAWLVEQLSEQLTANSVLLNSAVERINEQQRRIQLLETYHD